MSGRSVAGSGGRRRKIVGVGVRPKLLLEDEVLLTSLMLEDDRLLAGLLLKNHRL